MRSLKRRSSTKRDIQSNSRKGKKLLYRKYSRSRKISESYCLDRTSGRSKNLRRSSKGSRRRVKNDSNQFNSTFNESLSISKWGENSASGYQNMGVNRRKMSHGNSKKLKNNKKTLTNLRYKSKENYRKVLNRYQRSKSISGSRKSNFGGGAGKLYGDVFRMKNRKVDENLAKMMGYYKEKRYEKAIEMGEKVLQLSIDNVNALYITGLSCSMMEKHDKTIKYFSKLCEIKPKHKKNVYLFLSIAYKKIGEFENGVTTLETGLAIFKKFYEAFIYKGKLLMKLRRPEEAENSFLKAIALNDQKVTGLIGLADSYRLQCKFKEAICNYSSALSMDESLFPILGLKRAICSLEIGLIKEADLDITMILELSPDNCEAIYFKGLVKKIQAQYSEAVALYEQVIKKNHSEVASLKSLHDITLIKIKQRNIYAAYYTLDRLEEVPESLGYIQDLKIFLEAAVHLMKRKFKEGVDMLDKLGINTEIDENVKPLINSYRAFGNFSLGNIKDALDDYEYLSENCLQSDSDVFNMLLCKGIVATKNRMYKEAKQNFQNARKMNQKSIEPAFYLAMLKIQINFHDLYSSFNTNEKRNFRVLVEVTKDLEDILKLNDSSSNLYFQLSKLKMLTGNVTGAIEYLESAIDKSEDHYSDHFFWKGIALCMVDNHEASLGDFSTANEIERENFKKNKNEFTTDYLAWVGKRCQMLVTYGKSFLHLKDYDNGVRIFEKIEKFKAEEYASVPELKDRVKPIFDLYESKYNFHLGNFFYLFGYNHEACKLYKNSVIEYKEKTEFREEALLWLTKCYVTEKNLVRALEMLESLNDESSNPHYSFDYAIMNALKLTSSGDFVEAYNQFVDLHDYGGVIFKKVDTIFYAAVCLFYSGRFEDAKEQFLVASKMKYKSNRCSDFEGEALQRMMMEYLQDDIEDQVLPSCNQTFTKVEITYNCAICYLKLGKLQEAYDTLEKLKFGNLEDEGFYSDDLIQNLTVFMAPSVKKLKDLILKGLSSDTDDLEEPAVYEIEVFPSENRLCGIYNQVICKISEKIKVCVKLSFCLPHIPLPDTSISRDISEAKNIGISDIENRPEAPWIKRNDNVIIFTENFIENEAYYVEDVDELLKKIDKRMNSRTIKTNVEIIFEKYKKVQEEKEEKLKEKQRKTVKDNLQLHMDTENILSNILKGPENEVDEDFEARGSFFSQSNSKYSS